MDSKEHESLKMDLEIEDDLLRLVLKVVLIYLEVDVSCLGLPLVVLFFHHALI